MFFQGLNNFPKMSFNKLKREDIGDPVNVQRDISVVLNPKTGMLEGLPESWIKELTAQISQDERNANPKVAFQAIKYLKYTKKQKPSETYKLLFTEDAIEKESLEIDNILNVSNHPKRRNRNFDEIILMARKAYSGERDATTPLSQETKFHDESSQNHNHYSALSSTNGSLSEPVDSEILDLREKERYNASLSESEVFEEIKSICNSDDPLERFEKLTKLGSGATGKGGFSFILFGISTLE